MSPFRPRPRWMLDRALPGPAVLRLHEDLDFDLEVREGGLITPFAAEARCR